MIYVPFFGNGSYMTCRHNVVYWTTLPELIQGNLRWKQGASSSVSEKNNNAHCPYGPCTYITYIIFSGADLWKSSSDIIDCYPSNFGFLAFLSTKSDEKTAGVGNTV